MGWLRAIYRFDYMGHKRYWFAISGAIIAAGLVSMFVRGGGDLRHGLKYGLEFKTGTRVIAVFDKPTDLGRVRAAVADAGYPDAVIQEVKDEPNKFQIQTAALGADQEQALKTALQDEFGVASYSSSTVSPAFGRQVVSNSWKAALIALLLILVYITLRFEWRFAVGAIAAEVHDLLIVVSVYSLVGREVTTGTIAAVLTILGYSLYDTVIVFDRIRENGPKLGRLPYADIVNRSIWETLTRSINTTLLVLIPVVCLLLFGGATLKDFAFALLIGILSGAYSSIFVASPVLTILKEREPQYRKLASRARQS